MKNVETDVNETLLPNKTKILLKSLIIRAYRKFIERLRPISGYRNHPVLGPPIRFVANACSEFLEFYENHDYDIQTNGELFVLQSLASTQLSCLFDVGANQGNWLLSPRIFGVKIPRYLILKPSNKFFL